MSSTMQPLQQPIQLPIGYMIEKDLEIVKVLSIGAFGQVYMARNTQTFKRYAVKSLPHIGLDSNQVAFQQNEIALHSHLSDHPHIIRLEKVIRTKDWTHAILEYGSEGDLFTAIIDKSIYFGNHSLIRNVFLQLIDAVRYCHDNHIYHRDLKPENILVFNGGQTLKLADFGLATTDVISNDFGCGSTFYFSPECQGSGVGGGYYYATAPNDVWSLGIILINLSAGRNPWRLASLQDDTFRAYVNDPKLLLKILPISMELNKILKRIFCLDPQRRITLDELYNRIQKCKFFTRTDEVDQYESCMMLLKDAAAETTKKLSNKRKPTNIQVPLPSSMDNNTLPSPPDTPTNSTSYSSLISKEEAGELSTSTSASSLLTMFSGDGSNIIIPQKGDDQQFISLMV